jgi:hypothetical protein
LPEALQIIDRYKDHPLLRISWVGSSSAEQSEDERLSERDCCDPGGLARVNPWTPAIRLTDSFTLDR